MIDSGAERESIHAELERTRATLHTLTRSASAADLARRTQGTRWTNQQMLFHMVFGYLIVLRLRWLVKGFGRLPDRFSAVFARGLDAAARPFHVVNYVGSCAAALVLRGPRLTALGDRTIASLHRHLDHEPDTTLQRTMHFPVGWDPYFRDEMSLSNLYRSGTQHFDHHRRQLTLSASAISPGLNGR